MRRTSIDGKIRSPIHTMRSASRVSSGLAWVLFDRARTEGRVCRLDGTAKSNFVCAHLATQPRRMNCSVVDAAVCQEFIIQRNTSAGGNTSPQSQKKRYDTTRTRLFHVKRRKNRTFLTLGQGQLQHQASSSTTSRGGSAGPQSPGAQAPEALGPHDRGFSGSRPS